MEHYKIIWQHVPPLFDGVVETIAPVAPEEIKDLFIINEEQEQKEYAQGIITQSGIIGINENLNPYDFWVAHCSFRITKPIEKIIEDTDGVEFLKVLSPYRAKIAIGKYWGQNNLRGKVLTKIQETIGNYLSTIYNL